ncbi:hypothetical protein Pint_07402 [Pistacia integerrima]|uniref:Uncharacterized protein n=1 Tax=Pistacia integerrima TaxID=434235 RepID=A0ACC0XWT8_9ROSI|nr:hypothetical protein Pint_07402 [Pistacia integerrima]
MFSLVSEATILVITLLVISMPRFSMPRLKPLLMTVDFKEEMKFHLCF